MLRKILFVLAMCAAAKASAGPCVTLDYQEMKDMSKEELIAEACRANKISMENFENGLANLSVRQGPQQYPNTNENFQQCQGEVDRMLRALRTKGVQEKLVNLCKQRPLQPMNPTTP